MVKKPRRIGENTQSSMRIKENKKEKERMREKRSDDKISLRSVVEMEARLERTGN